MNMPAAGVFRTPLGWAGVAVTERGVAQVILPRKSRGEALRELAAFGRMPAAPPRTLQNAMVLLGRYLSGRAVSIDLPLDLRYYTPFRQAVWKAAAAIPYGETRSYAWIAMRIRRPKASRAVGQALGTNPVPLLIP
jgi:methylated-DNA-[protein]-cysteine S-methyltransferase